LSVRRLSPQHTTKPLLAHSNTSLFNPKLSIFVSNNRFLIGTASGRGRSTSTASPDVANQRNDVQNPADKKDTTEVTNKWENTKRLLTLIRAEMKLLAGALAALAVSSGTTLLFPAAIGRVSGVL